MTFKFFTPRPVTLDEGKAMYRKLAAQYHPDHGGSTEAMQEINAEWDALKGKLPRFVSKQAREGRAAYEAKQTTRRQVSPEVAEMAAKLSRMSGLKFDVVGSWIWAETSARHLQQLKDLGFTWSANRHMYYWHPAGETSGRARKSSYSHIYAKYEGQSYTGQGAEELAS